VWPAKGLNNFIFAASILHLCAAVKPYINETIQKHSRENTKPAYTRAHITKTPTHYKIS
jgi:hypothetical protein